MSVTRHRIHVEQVVAGKQYEAHSTAYSVDNNFSLMNQMMRMDNALYRNSGAILPDRIWWVEEIEF